MEWFEGPTSEFFGMPSFWIDRIAKAMQFVSGLVIIVEIVGKQRMEAFAGVARQRLGALTWVQFVRGMANDLWDTSRYFLLYVYASGQRQERYRRLRSAAKYDRPAVVAAALLAVAWTAVLMIGRSALDLHLAWLLPLIFLPSFAVGIAIVYTVVIPLFLLPILVIFWPLAFMLDLTARVLVGMLKREPLSRVLLVASLLLFVTGLLLEIAVS